YAPHEGAASFKILGVFGVIRVCLSPDLDMAFNDRLGDLIQPEHLALAGALAYPCGEGPGACGAVVLAFEPAVGFVGVSSPRPAQHLIVNDTVRRPKGVAGTNMAVIIGPTAHYRVEFAYQRCRCLPVRAFDALAGFLERLLH